MMPGVGAEAALWGQMEGEKWCRCPVLSQGLHETLSKTDKQKSATLSSILGWVRRNGWIGLVYVNPIWGRAEQGLSRGPRGWWWHAEHHDFGSPKPAGEDRDPSVSSWRAAPWMHVQVAGGMQGNVSCPPSKAGESLSQSTPRGSKEKISPANPAFGACSCTSDASTALTGGERPQLVYTGLGDRSDAEEQKLAAASLSVCPDLAKAFVSTSLACFPRAAFHRPSPFAQLRANHSLQHFTQLPSMMDAAWKHPAFLHCQIY